MKKRFRESKYFEDWLIKARRDLDTAYLNHRHKGYTDTTCYFCHQTAEKVLKAYLLAKGIKILPKTHIFPSLLAMCIQKDKGFSDFENICLDMNEYFIETKYPADAPVDYSKEEAERAIESADTLYKFVEKKIRKS